MRHRRPARSRRGRLLRWSVIILAAWVALTATPVLLLRWLDPFTSAFMLRERFGARAADGAGARIAYEWVDMERISPHAALAVIAAEDQRFPFHSGFDVDSIRDSLDAAARGRRLRGASTISQQVAKNLFLWPGRSLVRKGLEAWFTVLIETMWPKRRILEVYLNIAELGHGVYGVQAASLKFFGKPAARLTPGEAALLAAVLPNPRRFRADRPSAYVLSRRDWILGQMRSLGGLAYLDSVTRSRSAAS